MQTTKYSTKSAEIRSRIEPDLKTQSTEVLSGLGLDMSDAIRLFLRQVVVTQGLPFEVKAPNATTVAAMVEARLMKGRTRFNTSKEALNELEKADSKAQKEGQAAKKGGLHQAVRKGLAKA